MFLRNYWYAVAWDRDVKHVPFARTVCGESLVPYRHINGGLSAFEDCCPHRLLPLSMGFLKDDHLVCRYHGLGFDQCGKSDRMTPETEATTWYHWGMARDFLIEDRGLAVRIREGQEAVFAEDIEILNAQQENILRRQDRELLNLKIDAGGVQARWLVEREFARCSGK